MYRDHLECRRLGDTREGLGRLFFLDQYADGLRFRGRFELIRVSENCFSLKARSLYPVGRLAWLYPVGTLMTLKAAGNDTELTHEVLVGYSAPLPAAVLDWVVRKTVLTPDRIRRFDQHIIDEFTSLERLIAT